MTDSITPLLAEQRIRVVGKHVVGPWTYDRSATDASPYRTMKCSNTGATVIQVSSGGQCAPVTEATTWVAW